MLEFKTGNGGAECFLFVDAHVDIGSADDRGLKEVTAAGVAVEMRPLSAYQDFTALRLCVLDMFLYL